VLSEDWLQSTISKAQQSMREEMLHSYTPSNPTIPQRRLDIPDPDPAPSHSLPRSANIQESADPLEIWRMLPALKDLPEAMLRQLPRTEIFQLNAALAREQKSQSKVQANSKLLLNAQQLEKTPVKVEAGWDDRKKVLHEARFLGGASCSAQQLWLQARSVLGPTGVVPLGNYDLDSVGCGGSVTPRGWIAIHDPSSSDLKLKLFYLPNVGSSSLAAKKISVENDDGMISVGDSFKDIADMEAFRSALNTLREAMATALPWNRSVSAICGFLNNTNYCAADLNQNTKRAAILTEFVDYALSRNALNWENGQPFLSADDLSHTWATWKTRRVSSLTAAGKGQKNQKEKDNLCRKFNSPAGCPNSANDCKTFYGNKLRHLCSVILPTGKKCLKDHAKPDHK
jgi:hypothetical protein